MKDLYPCEKCNHLCAIDATKCPNCGTKEGFISFFDVFGFMIACFFCAMFFGVALKHNILFLIFAGLAFISLMALFELNGVRRFVMKIRYKG